jgi:DNA/RNA-binding domain of Phe-tRNA-synthetase-like protein
MKLTVKKQILDIIPKYTVLAFKFPIEIKESDKEIHDYINNLEKEYSTKTLEEVINLPRIKESRDGYKRFGKDPSRYRVACESLIRRLVKGMGLYYINNAVDIGNILSIELNRSIAVLDYDKIQGDVYFRLGREDDDYEGIGRGKINVSNIPLYVDDISPFGSPTSDTIRTSITNETKNILLFVTCFSDTYLEESKMMAEKLYKELGKVCTFEQLDVQYER